MNWQNTYRDLLILSEIEVFRTRGENTEYVEDLFLNKYSCLFDIEVLTLKQYIDKILISHKQFARHIYSQADLVFIMRHILSCHTFNTIQFSSNSYEMILELFNTLK